MGAMADCDACGKLISLRERAVMQFPSDGTAGAGISIELCMECAAEPLATEAVQTAAKAFELKRADTLMAMGMEPSPPTAATEADEAMITDEIPPVIEEE